MKRRKNNSGVPLGGRKFKTEQWIKRKKKHNKIFENYCKKMSGDVIIYNI